MVDSCAKMVLTPHHNTAIWFARHFPVKTEFNPIRAIKRKAPIVAKPELGEKRRCLSCETKYYDLNKVPIVCPKCSAVFELVAQTKPEPKAEPKPQKEAAKTVVSEAVADPDTISLEDADDDDGETVDGEDIPEDIPDVAVEDDDDETDGPFLEDDDEDDDVSDIISVPKDDKVDN